MMTSLWLCVGLLCLCGPIAAQEHDPVFISVEEGSDVLLPCSLSSMQDLETKLIKWMKVAENGEPRKEVFEYDAGQHSNDYLPGQDKQYKGRVSHYQDELRKGNASILLRSSTLADSGDYTCDFPRLQPSQRFSIRLTVFDAAQEPHLKILNAEDNKAVIQCAVKAASPKPEVQLRSSDGTVLQSDRLEVTEKEDGRFDVILKTTVTKSGHYSCVVTQKEIYHQVSSETFVLVKDEGSEEGSSKEHRGWLFGGIIVGVVLVVAGLAVAWLVLRRTKGLAIIFKKDGPQEGDDLKHNYSFVEVVPLKVV